jgi:hypothetical protein
MDSISIITRMFLLPICNRPGWRDREAGGSRGSVNTSRGRSMMGTKKRGLDLGGAPPLQLIEDDHADPPHLKKSSSDTYQISFIY